MAIFIHQAEEFGTVVISEDDFLDMIRTRPGMPDANKSELAKSTKTNGLKATGDKATSGGNTFLYTGT